MRNYTARCRMDTDTAVLPPLSSPLQSMLILARYMCTKEDVLYCAVFLFVFLRDREGARFSTLDC
jgi:hypothetical protein